MMRRVCFFFFKQKTAYEMRISDWSSDVCSSDLIAGACGISVRYLHELFRDVGASVGQWIKMQRLNACRDALLDPFNRHSIGEIAFHWGFSDQAQFSRSFRAQLGVSPRDLRRGAILNRADRKSTRLNSSH